MCSVIKFYGKHSRTGIGEQDVPNMSSDGSKVQLNMNTTDFLHTERVNGYFLVHIKCAQQLVCVGS